VPGRGKIHYQFVHAQLFCSCIVHQVCDVSATDALQPLLMEFLLLNGSCVILKDFNVPKTMLDDAHKRIHN
jgi:hypothetical protein